MTETTTLGAIEAERVHAATGIAIRADSAQRTELERRLATTWDDRRSPWERGQCKVCGKPLDCEDFQAGAHQFQINVCESCGPIVTAHYSPEEQAKTVTLNPWWEEHCPRVYRELIEGKTLPAAVDKAAFDRVQAWTSTAERGLVLIGASGAGKTLALWQKSRDLERAGVRPVLLSAVDFARCLSVAARDLEQASWLMRTRVLAIDDLGKERLTSAVAALLWEVVDARVNARLPTIITTRFGHGQFVARFADPILGEDIRGRIADASEVIFFGPRPPKSSRNRNRPAPRRFYGHSSGQSESDAPNEADVP